MTPPCPRPALAGETGYPIYVERRKIIKESTVVHGRRIFAGAAAAVRRVRVSAAVRGVPNASIDSAQREVTVRRMGAILFAFFEEL